MKEFVEKLIDRLEEYKYSHLVERDKERLEHCTENERAEHCEGIDCFWCVWDKATEIVNQLAEEYKEKDCSKCSRRSWYQKGYADAERNNGWIPCSERLPSKEGEYLTFVEYDDDEFIAIDEFLCEGILKEWNCTPNYRVIAWMELPEKYKEKKNGSS